MVVNFEDKELVKKIEKLEAFYERCSDEREKILIEIQLNAMKTYSQCLTARVENFLRVDNELYTRKKRYIKDKKDML